jgi:hypothetical protein
MNRASASAGQVVGCGKEEWPARYAKSSVDGELDQLRFRVVEENGRHVFRNVHLDNPDIPESERSALVRFLEGRCLEDLNPGTLAKVIGPTPVLPLAVRLIKDLKALLV